MTTFSQLVDKMILETKRPELLPEVVTYLNQTLRELHTEPDRGNAVFFSENLKETQITVTENVGFSWTIPNPSVFQGIMAVRYDGVFTNGNATWAQEIRPGRAQNSVPHSFYRAGNRVFFSNYGELGAKISIAYFEFTRSLGYFTQANRPATYNESLQTWTYKAEYDVNDETREAAQELVTNWLLLRWGSVIEEGLRAKIYKRISDTERARTSYSMYTTLRRGVYTSEVADLGGSW
jgi:hypothetical protein